MKTALVLFTRDLRIHDNPALLTACARAERVIPLFVLDPAIRASANRRRFLRDCLADLRESLRGLGGDLVIRSGDPVAETMRLAARYQAETVDLAADVSAFAARRLSRLTAEPIAVHTHPGVTVVPPGAVRPGSGDHYKVFTPYWRAWSALPWRPVATTPRAVRLPAGIEPGELPELRPPASPDLIAGGESEARRRLGAWDPTDYDEIHDDLAADRTSHLSPFLRFGCVSPLEVARTVGHEGFVRQLAWRDFHHQVTAAFPEIMRRDYRPRGTEWNEDPEALAAWRDGRTGCLIVDAGMRQLRQEGWMHNRARMITASYLSKSLRIDWRHGLAHFGEWLADADVADNAGNWQWIAGTGNDTRPNRVLNPQRQADRFDRSGEYVRRYLPDRKQA
ncbi:MAG: deoxyribodipyrimidine photo-lyase [Streptosporangiaceae bacterium]